MSLGTLVFAMSGFLFIVVGTKIMVKEMRSIITYLTYISKGIKTVEDIPWKGENAMKKIPEPNVENGEELYEKKNCLSYHATDDAGTSANSCPAYGGDNSFNDGAGMGRMTKTTYYIKNNKRPDDDGSLIDQEAADIAAFILSRDRPVWEGHDTDGNVQQISSHKVDGRKSKKINLTGQRSKY